ncbi:MAG: hypothetical protein GVY32_13055 [Gammaproteobacteria bacterium]|jgi:hypothetical protein|nr:hypothetical protein [Gammaproteobacteria bacterium]
MALLSVIVMIHSSRQGSATARVVTALAAIGFVLAATPGLADTLTVETSADVIADDGDCSLREAIINANNGDQSGSTDCLSGTGPADGVSDTIAFSPSLDGNPIVLSIGGAGENDALTGDLDVSDALRIEGRGPGQTIIDANGLDRVLEVRDDEAALTTMSLQLNGLTLRNGAVEDWGGGIYSRGASTSLLLENCFIESNNAAPVTDSALGGGVATEGPTVITNSRLADNLASAAGASTAAGGGIAANNNLLVRSTVISGNRAESETGETRGGGVLSTPGGGPLLIEDSVLRDNEIEGGEALGGGIFAQDLPGILGQAAIIQSEISGNSVVAPGGISAGGGLFLQSPGTITVGNATFTGNTVGAGVSAAAAGGAIANDDMNLTVGNATVSENSVDAGPDAEGGGIYFESATASTTLANSIIAGNTASGDGAPDCRGPFDSIGHNLLGSNAGCPGWSPGSNDIIGDVAGGGMAVDPMLDPLADNGGDTRTMALTSGSPAIDAGNPSSSGPATELCSEVDQRNINRPFDGDDDETAVCDIGAFELAPDAVFQDRFESD